MVCLITRHDRASWLLGGEECLRDQPWCARPGDVRVFFFFTETEFLWVRSMPKFAIFTPNSEPQADLLEIYKAGGGGGGKAS